LGDRLGLYRALDGRGPTTADELAQATGLHRRWLLEWLRGNAAAELLESEDGEHFELTREGAAVLAHEEHSVLFAAGAFTAPTDASVIDDLAEAFRTGIGLPYDRLGPNGAHSTERSLGPWARVALVPRIIPALDGVAAKLERGARVADIGCGAGVALTALAEAYPGSTFHGYELSRHALDRARQRVDELELTNVELFATRAEDLPADAAYDFVLTFDCIHDMTHPQEMMATIREAIAPEGSWLLVDIKARESFTENAEKNPMASMMYGMSVMSCMASALSEPGGAGLGTLGLPESRAKEMSEAAGFTRFQRLPVDHPVNAFYEIRP
jgi:2-polyprenyl-3-methyl-5-hydroxy-6-metoxy-1,4-benzoquinol methylase